MTPAPACRKEHLCNAGHHLQILGIFPLHILLSQPPSLTFGLEQAQDIILTNCQSLSVSDIVCFWVSIFLPGPFTLRMMERVVSSMNSTRTCVTPPREPAVCQNFVLAVHLISTISYPSRTSAAEDSGDFDELDGNPALHVSVLRTPWLQLNSILC